MMVNQDSVDSYLMVRAGCSIALSLLMLNHVSKKQKLKCRLGYPCK